MRGAQGLQRAPAQDGVPDLVRVPVQHHVRRAGGGGRGAQAPDVVREGAQPQIPQGLNFGLTQFWQEAFGRSFLELHTWLLDVGSATCMHIMSLTMLNVVRKHPPSLTYQYRTLSTSSTTFSYIDFIISAS